MLASKEFALVACMFGPTTLFAFAAWWHCPRLGWPTVGVLVSAVGIVLYLPIRAAFHTPSSFDANSDGFGVALEFMAIGGLLAVVHLSLVLIIGLLLIEKVLERRKVEASRGNDEVPGND